MYKLIRPLLFSLPPETAHRLVMGLLDVGIAAFWKHSVNCDSRLEREVFGLRFPNPVGLAAGFDKEAGHIKALSELGFGFLELGTVTPLPQVGNPQPRLFRLPQARALINRMGFNNAGVEAFAKQLSLVRLKDKMQKGKSRLILGANIGKNKATPNEEALRDYAICLERLFPYVDYFVVNVSSPNTPGLRQLQEKKPLANLLCGLQELNDQNAVPRPLLLKIAPDLSNSQLSDVLQIAFDCRLSGLIATNTTISREGLGQVPAKSLEAIGAGGLSGAPLRRRSTEVIRFLYKESQGKLPIIGVGGIQSPDDALEKLDAGASLIQLFTGLIYEGPSLIRRINKALLA